MACCTSILRVGPGNDHRERFSRALMQHFEVDSDQLQLSNRYFSAHVQLFDLSRERESHHKEDGILLIFDSSSSLAFDALDDVHKTAERAGAGDLLRLCIGIDQAGISVNEKEYSRRIMWCLDRGYEYVLVDLSEEGIAKGHDQRDKEGFARVVEAVQGTVWSSAVMHKKKIDQLKQSYREDVAKAAEEEEKEASDPLAAGNSEREELARQAILEQCRIADPLLEQENWDPINTQQAREELEQERMLDQFEGALREAGRIRELSHSGMLSDEDRRKRAEDAAVLLMSLMDRMGFDESDDEKDAIDCELGEVRNE